MAPEGWHGWDEYAPFYDWENARTLGRRDVAFWQRVVKEARGPVLELGCGTGRVTLPLARSGAHVVGIDRSEPMLVRARQRSAERPKRSADASRSRFQLVRGDIRSLPFARHAFSMVIAPYGVLQSLVRERDLTETLSAVADAIAPGGLFGIDLVPDVPNWREYSNRIQMRGRSGRAQLTLVESVRQEPRRRLTIFDQQYIVRRNGRRTTHRFELVFRTLGVREMSRRVERAGFLVEAVLGDYRGSPWDERAEVWIILARRT